MARNFSTYWYQEDNQFREAFLYNCRDNDITSGGAIGQGAIVQGILGYCIAEENVAGYTGHIVPFKPNRRCIWQGFEVDCLCHPNAPASPKTKKDLRGFNYVVADLSSPDVRVRAETLKLPLITAGEKTLANLELDVFEGQGRGSARRAKLI